MTHVFYLHDPNFEMFKLQNISRYYGQLTKEMDGKDLGEKMPDKMENCDAEIYYRPTVLKSGV